MEPDRATDRILIEIDPVAQPITGTVHQGSAPVRPFHGWLELVALVEAASAAGVGGAEPA